MMLTTLLVILAFGLAVLFAAVLNGWRETVTRTLCDAVDLQPRADVALSVVCIVPARDAAHTILPLLQDLYALGVPGKPPEVIVVDDASTDDTAARVRTMMPRWPGLRLLPCEGVGKKAAITTGVAATDAEWILMTDADARCGADRLRRLLAHVHAADTDMVLMPAATDGTGLLGSLQENEQAALMLCAAGTAIQGLPLLANGANMAFRRSAFLEVGGYSGDRYASGDDVFLVQRMVRAGKHITYLPDPGSAVRVEAERTWGGFFRQRLRWAGKMRGAAGPATAITLLVLLFPWLLLALTLAVDWPRMVGHRFLMVVLLLAGAWTLWLCAIPPLVRDAKRILDQRYTWAGSMLSFLAFSVYAPVVALLALFVRSVWKGRRV